MKLNLEIEIDWIDEEMNMDSVVKQEVIRTISNKLTETFQAKAETEINKIVDQTVVKNINDKVDALFDDFMNREVCISDNYGSTIKTFPDMTAVIKSKFDNFMIEKVDGNGKPTSSSYSDTSTRLYYIIDKQLKQFADKFTTDAVKKVSDEIRVHVNEGLTTKLGAELMKVLKVEKMLNP